MMDWSKRGNINTAALVTMLLCNTLAVLSSRQLIGPADWVFITLGSEADLDMFSMFGRTGAPQKGGPTKGQKIVRYAYKYYSNTPSFAYSLLQKGWPQTASQLLLQ